MFAHRSAFLWIPCRSRLISANSPIKPRPNPAIGARNTEGPPNTTPAANPVTNLKQQSITIPPLPLDERASLAKSPLFSGLLEEKHVLLKNELDEKLQKEHALELEITKQFEELKRVEISLEKRAHLTAVEE